MIKYRQLTASMIILGLTISAWSEMTIAQSAGAGAAKNLAEASDDSGEQQAAEEDAASQAEAATEDDGAADDPHALLAVHVLLAPSAVLLDHRAFGITEQREVQ